MSTSFSETVSVKRGRPQEFTSERMAIIRSLFPEIRTDRGIVAKCYETEAVKSLHVDHQWVDGVSRIVGEHVYSATILEQLGRLKRETDCPDEVVVKFARDLNDELTNDPAMTIRDAVETMRIVRSECRRIVENGGSQG